MPWGSVRPGNWDLARRRVVSAGSLCRSRSSRSHALLFELKDDDQRKVDFAAGRGKTPPVPIVRSGKSALDDDCTVCVMNGLGMEAEVGKSLLVLSKQRGTPGAADPYLSGREPRLAMEGDGGE